MTVPRVLIGVCVAGLVLAGVAGADGAPLQGSVGPGFSISLADGSGGAVTHLAPGTFSLSVDDKSDEHNFHLQGPGGVDVSTTVEDVGVKTFALTLVDGTYSFLCDAHPSRMSGSFTVGTAAPEVPPKPPATKPPVQLVLTLTGKGVGLATSAGRPVKSIAPGSVVITVRDRSSTRGIRLTGAGVSRSTGVRFVGTVTWRVKLVAGALAYGSGPGKPVVRGGRVTVS